MRRFIYWALTASTLFLVSRSDNSTVALEEEIRIPSSGVGENIEYAVSRFGGTGNDVITDAIKVDVGIILVGHTNSVDGNFEGVNAGGFRYNDSSAFIMKINLSK